MTHTHTPKPWHIGKRSGNPAIYGKDGTEVAEILHGLTPEWRANARLIAAAPELLAALIASLDYVVLKGAGMELSSEALNELCAGIRAAIAKAEGNA
jgi:hypothetical protein